VSALDPARAIQQYKHTTWTIDNGAPPVILSLAQGRDGYLWIGTGNGLFRFDGVTFEYIPQQQRLRDRANIVRLLAARDGTIWAGYAAGGVARYDHGALRDMGLPNATAYVMGLAETADGAIWAQFDRAKLPLARYRKGRWEDFGAESGLPDEPVGDIMATRDGALWVVTRHAVLVLRRDAKRFATVSVVPVGHGGLSEDPAGRVWLSDDSGSKVVTSAPSGRLPYPTPSSQRLIRSFFDKDGNLWGITTRNGIFRVRVPDPAGASSPAAALARVDTFGLRDGLTADTTTAIMQDREGSVWVGTTLGLDRFRAARVIAEPSLTKLPIWGFALLGASDGSVYVGEAEGFYRILPGGNPQRILDGAGESEAVCEGPDGSVWMITQQRITRFSGGRFTAIARPPSPKALIDCAVDRHNDLWITAEDGLYQRSSAGWRLYSAPDNDAMPIIRSRDGRLLLYRSAESLRRIDFPHRTDIVVARPRALRRLRTIYDGSGGVLLGGGLGLARWQDRPGGGRVQFFDPERIRAFSSIVGIAQTPAGETWLLGKQGIVHLPTALLNRGFDDPRVHLNPTVLDFRDGLLGSYSRDGKRDAVRGGDGRIWFATTAGTVWVDADHLARNKVPPPVAISGLKSGSLSYRDPANVTLPRGSSMVEIDFATLSLSIPERVRVRYILEGVSPGWMDPGMRRQAFYTNLGPGTYRFRVIAANDDGVWNREGAMLEFTIPPTFLQSVWFKLLCLIGVGVLLWLAYSIRLRQVTARVRSKLEVRLAERERIARELHDTLLQGFQGLVLRFQSIANRIPPDQPLRPLMDDALDRAEAVLVEGRDRVRELRATSGDLTQTLLDTAHELAATWPVRFDLTIEGTPRALHPMVRDEVQHIGEEALRNAFQHAKASTIEAVITYLPGELRLDLRDDGTGLPADIASAGEREGHFGLIGMRERATRIGGTLTISSRKGAGTEILLSIPGAAAYAERRGRHWLPRFLTGRMKG
jgi:signal transduction histidine kinase/ligand-binding sensor domain-containing protein